MNEEFIKDYFHFTCDPVARPEAVISGDHYRFTVLTSRLIRMEYSASGKFEDRPTQTVWFRNLEVPSFQVIKSDTLVKIETADLILEYNPTKKFSSASLKITLKNLKRTWRYGQKGHGNLKGTSRTLDGTNGFSILEPGLMSKQGFTVLDDSKSLVFNESYWLTPKDEFTIDLYFFGHGTDYLSCLKDYYLIAGKTPMIPRFVLGNWWSRYWEYTETELKTLINTFDQHHIPLSVCIIDMDWHLVKIDHKYGGGWTGYTWNKEFFPDPEGMLNWLHSKDLKIALNLHPAEGIRAHEECYPAVADFMGVNKATEEPIKFDIADPKFVSAYFDLVHHPLEDQGVDFWWLDWQQGHHTNLQNLDPLWLLNHLHYYDLGRDKKKRSFIFSRWGGKGNHRYPIGFSGDTWITWRSLAYQPYFTTTASNIGYGWWSHDIGGHMAGKENAELYTRWVQFGIFSPIMRLHSTKNAFIKREPWKHDFNTLHYAGDAMRLRHRLIPYIYSMAYQNFANDIPLMRPLYYLSPQEARTYKFRNQYWYGSELLAAPITQKRNKTSKRVLQKIYLPPQQYGFFNFFSDEFFDANQIITRIFDLGDIPVFAKAGAIIPLDGDGVRNTTSNPEQLNVEIFPGDSNLFQLYEDDGNSESYKQGEFHLTTLKWTWGDDPVFSIEQTPDQPNYIPANRQISLLFHCLDLNDVPEINSDTNLEISSEIVAPNHSVKISIPSKDLSNVSITFHHPAIVKKNALKEQAYHMLLDADIVSYRKKHLDGTFFKAADFTEKDLIHLFHKCG